MRLRNKGTVTGATAAVLLFFGCGVGQKSGNDSLVTGASVVELQRYEGEFGKEFKPDYALLSTEPTPGHNVVRVAIFFSYDHSGEQMSDGEREDDYATKAFDAFSQWAYNPYDESRSFLKTATGADSEESGVVIRRLSGRGPALAGLHKSIQWEISLYRGDVDTLAVPFGKAMAESDISVMNGHFYPQDADNPLSRIYKPALEAFESAASGTDTVPSRLVVLNGCYSEQIESMVLDYNKRAGKTPLAMIGMRGRSNYLHFAPQLARFLNSLVVGDKWTDVLSAFELGSAIQTDAQGTGINYGGGQPPAQQGSLGEPATTQPVLRYSSANP